MLLASLTPHTHPTHPARTPRTPCSADGAISLGGPVASTLCKRCPAGSIANSNQTDCQACPSNSVASSDQSQCLLLHVRE